MGSTGGCGICVLRRAGCVLSWEGMGRCQLLVFSVPAIQTKLEQRHMERLQAKVTVVMAFAADSAPAVLVSLVLAVTAGRNLCPAPGCWDPVTGSLQNLPVLLAVPSWGQH